VKSSRYAHASAATDFRRWLLLDTGIGHYDFNMALDEALLEAMPRLRAPILRFYGWAEPAASFGYFQKYGDIERLTLLRSLVRRPTAGGLVPHDADWTYSLAFPSHSNWYALSAVESYQRAHECVRAAFERLGVRAELAPCCHKAQPGECFAGYERNDVLWEGRKIAGAAQRRKREGLLIQGSVQPPPLPLERETWQRTMRDVAAAEFGIEWTTFQLDPALLDRVSELARHKYSRPDYNRKR